MSLHCNYCNLYFTGLPAFYRHRTGEGNARRCLSELEMFQEGLRLGEHYAAREIPPAAAAAPVEPAQRGRYITAPIERKRMPYEPKESIQAAHVRWLFGRGVSPERIAKAGIPTSVVVRVVDEEVQRLRERS